MCFSSESDQVSKFFIFISVCFWTSLTTYNNSIEGAWRNSLSNCQVYVVDFYFVSFGFLAESYDAAIRLQ